MSPSCKSLICNGLCAVSSPLLRSISSPVVVLAKLMMDDDVQKKSGIYPYVLDGDERHLNIRAFSNNMKREAYERQQGVCVKCEKQFRLEAMEGDHIKPWHEGGKTNAENCQMLCKPCNRRKGGD